MSPHHTASAPFEYVDKILNEYNCEKNVVAQTCDGTATKVGEVNGLNK